jgi:hypothetical protein
LPPGIYTVWFIGQILGVTRRRRFVDAQERPADPAGLDFEPRTGRHPTRLVDAGAKLRLEITERRDDPIKPAPRRVVPRPVEPGPPIPRSNQARQPLTAPSSLAYSFSRGACLQRQAFQSDEPKSTSAIDLSPCTRGGHHLAHAERRDAAPGQPATSDGICRIFGGAAP